MSTLRFLCDENISRDLGLIVRSEGFDVSYLVDSSRGEIDEDVLSRALVGGQILITEDPDFGRLIFSDGLHSGGVVLLRIVPWKRDLRHERFRYLLRNESHRLAGHFTVLGERTIRIRPILHVRPD